jgi:hypothetical protein
MMTSTSILSSNGLLISPRTGELEADLAIEYSFYDCDELRNETKANIEYFCKVWHQGACSLGLQVDRQDNPADDEHS